MDAPATLPPSPYDTSGAEWTSSVATRFPQPNATNTSTGLGT